MVYNVHNDVLNLPDNNVMKHLKKIIIFDKYKHLMNIFWLFIHFEVLYNM